MQADASAAPRARLSVATKTVYGLGDHTVNLVLSAASLLYLAFLTQFGGLRPSARRDRDPDRARGGRGHGSADGAHLGPHALDASGAGAATS